MHQTVENILRTILYSSPPRNMTQARDIVDQALSQAMHAIRTTVMTTIGSSPGSLAFSRDMFLNIPLVADWQEIAKHREQRINDDLRRANLKQRQYDYCSGQKVLKRVHHPTKLGVRTSGPYPIERVHVNGTLTIYYVPVLPSVSTYVVLSRIVEHVFPLIPVKTSNSPKYLYEGFSSFSFNVL